MKFFRAFVQPFSDDSDGMSDGSEETQTGASEMAEIVMKATDGKLAGQWNIPDDLEEAKRLMDKKVFRQTAKYGTGENWANGFDPSFDEGLFELGREIILDPIEDDSKKPTVKTRLIEVSPGLTESRSKFKVELRVAIVNKDGDRIDWSDPYHTEPRYRKADLIPLLDDLVRTKVPSERLNENPDLNES